MTTLQKLLLANRCKVPLTEADRHEISARFGSSVLEQHDGMKDHAAWTKLYYGEQPKKSREHLKKLAVDFPAVAKMLEPHVEELLVSIAKAEELRTEKKAALEQRRADRAAKAAKKVELGVNLKGKGGELATEETYRTLRAGLKGIQQTLADWLHDAFRKRFADIDEKLRANDGKAHLAFPLREWNRRTRQEELVVGSYSSPHPLFTRVFDVKHLYPSDRGVTAVLKPDADAILRREANQAADEAVAGFSAKLAGKIDTLLAEQSNGGTTATVTSVVCTTINIWENSVLTVHLSDGNRQTWHTKVIWNQSVLGKQFNQWPTRLIA
jgi:hypothetical protein